MARHNKNACGLSKIRDVLAIIVSILFIIFVFITFFRGNRSEQRQIILVDSTLKLEANIEILVATTLRIECRLINFFDPSANCTIV